jgi:hypothetical protein
MYHKGPEWWNLGNPTVIPGNPGGVFTDRLEFSASATLSLFEGYPPIRLNDISEAFQYQFCCSPQGYPLYADSLVLTVNDTGLVTFAWRQQQHPYPPTTFVGYRVQRSGTDNHSEYATISDREVLSPFYDTPSSGTWYYRLALVLRIGPCSSVVAIVSYSEGLRVEIPGPSLMMN